MKLLRWIIIGCCSWLILLMVLVLLAGCNAVLSPNDEARINRRFAFMYQLAQLPRPPPEIIYTRDPNFQIGGLTTCNNWTITINYGVAASRPDFVIEKLIPHEYAHLVSCFYRSGTSGKDGNAHDDYWRDWVIRFGGDPDYI